MSAVVSLTGVMKMYRRGREQVKVLHGIDLEVGRGEFVALMGPSGSGKTTLLNLVGGLDRADSGEVTVAGQSLGKLSSSALATWRARNVGFVFQFYNLLSTLSAEHNVEVPLLLTSLTRRDRGKRVAAALALVGLTDRARHTPAELSGGQQQRVAIARALIADPALLICDEPTGDLDRESAEDVLSLLEVLNQQGKTILMVTHDARAAGHASRSVHLDKGRLSAQTPVELAVVAR